VKYLAQKHGVTQKAVKEALQKVGSSRESRGRIAEEQIGRAATHGVASPSS
jgi:hypothetical protein